jgi:hypothetical protein
MKTVVAWPPAVQFELFDSTGHSVAQPGTINLPANGQFVFLQV